MITAPSPKQDVFDNENINTNLLCNKVYLSNKEAINKINESDYLKDNVCIAIESKTISIPNALHEIRTKISELIEAYPSIELTRCLASIDEATNWLLIRNMSRKIQNCIGTNLQHKPNEHLKLHFADYYPCNIHNAQLDVIFELVKPFNDTREYEESLLNQLNELN